MLKLLLLLCSCTQFVTCHCTTVLYISQYCTLAHRDIIHITATCGHANVNIARHYIVVCTSQYCHSHIQMYIVYISIFTVYFYSCNIAVLLLFLFYLCVCLLLFCLSWHSMWTAKKEFHCTGKLAFPPCAHDNKRFESLNPTTDSQDCWEDYRCPSAQPPRTLHLQSEEKG